MSQFSAHPFLFAPLQLKGKDQTPQRKRSVFQSAAMVLSTSLFPFIRDQQSFLRPTQDNLELTDQIKRKKRKTGCLPIPPSFIYQTISSPQQPDPKHIFKHIPLKWMAVIFGNKVSHTKTLSEQYNSTLWAKG